MDTAPPRRVVTGHDAAGTSIVVSDGEIPVVRRLPAAGATFFEVWNTEGAPAPITAVEPSEPTQRTLAVPPPRHGTKIRVNEFLPGHLDAEDKQSPMHRTATIDYGIVLQGEMVLILDDSEVELKAGDIVVQRGTDHAWANRGTATARMCFVLVDAEFAPELTAILPAGAIDALMHDVA